MHARTVSASGQQKIGSVSHVAVEHLSDEVKVTLIVAPPVVVSEASCERITGVPAKQWARTLRRWGVPFVKAGRLHTARISEIEAAILRLEKRPARTSNPAEKNDVTEGPRSTDDQVKAALARVRGAA